jgi:hypothetical protein
LASVIKVLDEHLPEWENSETSLKNFQDETRKDKEEMRVLEIMR